jgi:hypothetical protein
MSHYEVWVGFIESQRAWDSGKLDTDKIKQIKLHHTIITYSLRPRESSVFCGPETGHNTHCFPEVSVNKCFVIGIVYKCQSMK